MPYCIVRKDPSDTDFDIVRSKHKTKKAALKRTGRRNRLGRVVKCSSKSRKGARALYR